MRSDIEIAESIEMKNILDIANKLGLSQDQIEQYGKYKAKISVEQNPKKDSKLYSKKINGAIEDEKRIKFMRLSEMIYSCTEDLNKYLSYINFLWRQL